MLAYNGSVPGPTLRVRAGLGGDRRVENRGDLEATVHWHGLRLDNRYDGTHETQAPMEVGASFTYRLQFPDPGLYWYHPHIRQDYGQEMGLYGNHPRRPDDPDYWAPAHREIVVTLDDVLIEDGRIAPFSRAETTYAAMGRFGNELLVNGETDLALDADAGEVVRFYLINTANTRVFNVAVRGARMKLVGGDSGRCEREELVESVVLAPSERAVVDVRFDAAGDVTLEHRTPERTYQLAAITVGDGAVDPAPDGGFDTLRDEPGDGGRARTASRPYRDARARQDHRVRRRDGLAATGGRRSSTAARCTPRSSAEDGQVPRVRDEADRRLRPPRPTPARCTPTSSATSTASAPSAA